MGSSGSIGTGKPSKANLGLEEIGLDFTTGAGQPHAAGHVERMNSGMRLHSP
jgi:hypothetical protein